MKKGLFSVVVFTTINLCLICAEASMVSIPAGTNSGTDPDFGAYSLTLTNTLLMDATEISYEAWRGIYDWAVTNGYQFDHAGSRKEAGHPVHSINWYDCVKWCNARSEMDGLSPCYSVSGSVYRTGAYDADTDYNASGYRLPTWEEFEYAARGGVSSQRFPWGEFITHGEANYFSLDEFDYDLSPTKGGHPDYAYGDEPYTAPCGSFSPNGFGLYDVAGNVWEWCNNPAGTGRHARSGGGYGYAEWLRCAASRAVQAGGSTDEAYHALGFRTVRAFNVVEEPEFSPDGGQHPGGIVQVEITCETPGATVRYETGSGTIPGQDPGLSSPTIPGTGMVSVPVPGWLKSKAWKDGASPSTVKSAVYSIAQTLEMAGWRYPMNDPAGHACLSYGSTIPSGGGMTLEQTIDDVDSVLTGDVDGDGELEIVVTSGSTLRIHSGSGSIERTVALPRDCFVSMLEDMDGDSTPEIFLGGGGTGFASFIYRGDGTLLQTFNGLHAGGSDVTMRPIGLNNGKMLVGYNAGYARTPRGVAAFDLRSAAETWYYQIGPANGLYSLTDMDADGVLDITMSAHTVHNGASGNGTTDGDLYTIVVDENGVGKLTRIYDAPRNGNSSHVFADLDADGTYEILGFKGHDSTYYPGQAKIHRFAPDGTVLNTFNGPNNSRWTGLHAVGDLDGDTVPEIVATANYSATSNKTYVLDANLIPLAESGIDGKVELIGDLDGDGYREVVLLSRNGMVSLLGMDLSLISSLQLDGLGSEVIASDLEGDGQIELLCRVDGKLHIVGFRASDGLVVEPNASFVSSGTMGVGLSPSSMAYTLSNTGETVLAWSASTTESWLDLLPSGGTIGAGATASLEVGFSGDALALPAGSYEGTVEIAVQGAPSTQQRAVLLSVIEPSGSIAIEDSILPSDDRNMDFGQSVVNEGAVEQVTIRNTSAQYDLVVDGVGLSWSENGGAENLQMMTSPSKAELGESVGANPAVPPTAISANAEYRPGVMLVGYAKGQPMTAMEKASLHAAMGTESIKAFSMVPAELVKLPPGAKLEEMIEAYAADPNVAYAEPDYLVNTCELPNDPRLSELWGMRNTGQTGGTPGADIGAEQAWAIATGTTNVIVAVIDTGIDYTHPDLAANMWVNEGEIPGNGIDDDGNGFVDDVHGYDFAYNDSDPMDVRGHGTHCAGTIGAVGDNGVGVAGVNWRVRLMAAKFLNDSGSGYTSDAVDALEYAVANGAHISNNSWSGGGYSSTLKAAIEAAGAAGHLFVAAAGNSGSNNDVDPHYPSSYDCENILAVASSDHNDNRSGFSCYGLTSVDIAAPGSSILSTVPGNGYGLKSGTSMATPHAAGVAALLKSQRMDVSHSELKQWLIDGVDQLPQWDGVVVSGGRLNVANSLLLSDPPFVLEALPSWPATLPPGGSLSFDVRKTARRPGLYQGLVTIASNDAGEPEAYVHLSSEVLYDRLAVMPLDGIELMHETGAVPVPAATSFALENHSAGNIAWSVSGAPWWLAVDPAQGSLAGGASAMVDLALDPAVAGLPPGTYEATLEFANETYGTVLQRAVELTVNPATIASFDLDADPGWSMEGGWEFGVPQGGGSLGGDPTAGYTGTNVFGYNLAGDYPNNLLEYWLTSTPIDCSAHTNVQLRFWRWLGIENSIFDHAGVEVSANGTDWHPVWTHDGGSFSEASWNEVVYDISTIADGAPSVWVRWGMGTTDSSVTYPGWNIDDIVIEGTPLIGAYTPVHYVNVSNTTPVAPYASWATAATNIQDAVDAAASNDTVLVTNGTCYIVSEIVVDKDILVESVNGPGVTIVDGQGRTRCFNLGVSACVISELTIQNGHVDWYGDDLSGCGGGVYCGDNSSLLTNCIVKNCIAAQRGGGIYKGSLVDCRVIANRVFAFAGYEAYGGGAYDSDLGSCTISGNVARLEDYSGQGSEAHGGGLYGGSARNCLVLNNECEIRSDDANVSPSVVSAYGGGACNALLTNCTVVGNSARAINASNHLNDWESYWAIASGGGLYNCFTANSIIWSNSVDAWAILPEYYGGYEVGLENSANISGTACNSCSPDLVNSANGNISITPGFIDEGYGIYRLQSNSPCINWGNNTYTSSLVDLDGSNRVVEGFVDMGCYEYQGILNLADSDNDGLPDEWERQHFGGNADPNGDADGDGHNNREERISGMDPRSGSSVFAASNFVSSATGERIIQWPHVADRYYSVYWKEDLQSESGWIPVEVNLQSGIFTDTVHGAESHGFYKLEVGTEPVTPANKVLKGISIEYDGNIGPTYIYNCTGYFSDGSTDTVEAVWQNGSTNEYWWYDLEDGTYPPGNYKIDLTAEANGFVVSKTIRFYVEPKITSISVVGPSTVTPPGPYTYKCIALYNDGTTNDITEASPPPYLYWNDDHPSTGISGGGLTMPYEWYETINISVEAQTEYGTFFGGKSVYVSPNISYVSVSGPSSVDENSAAQYECLVHYYGGFADTVVADFQINTTYAEISSNGLLTAYSVPSDQEFELYAVYGPGITSDTIDVTIKDVSAPTQPLGTVLVPTNSITVDDGVYSGYTLTVTNAFYMDECEVSGALWSEVYDWAVTNGYDFSTNGVWSAPDHPVTWVNWYDCTKWCNARSEMAGRGLCYWVGGSVFKTGQVANVLTDLDANGFRMPTHDEWEYAARGGHGDYLYPTGGSISPADANYTLASTVACGSYTTNDFGLYDMAGNVWEWCDNITVTNDIGVAERRGRASGGYGSSDSNYLRCGAGRNVPCDGFTDNAWKSLGFRTICYP